MSPIAVSLDWNYPSLERLAVKWRLSGTLEILGGEENQ
jgi:hypothetical protein